MERMMDQTEASGGTYAPRVNVWDNGTEFVLEAELPGLSEKDVTIRVNHDVLTLEGERKVEVPEGASVHRRERPSLRFARSFTLPTKVDPDKVTATLTNGVLTVTLARAADAQPRQIPVRVQ
jgi:HSP20 family protein